MLGTGQWDTIAYAAPALSGDPFALGVASGDPAPTSVVLWTRLVTDPLAADGRGGMPQKRFRVQYQVATDEKFKQVVKSGNVFASPDLGHSVHPEIHGLKPGRHYWYRFRVGSAISPVGRTRTAPAPGRMPAETRFGVASCQSYEGGQYTALQHLADEDFDLVLHLGDYIYEQSYVDEPKLHNGDPLPDQLRTECFDLPRYRLQYSLYKSDQHLQNAHASCAWMTTFDDHEVEDSWRADVSKPDDEPDQDPEVFRQRKAAAFQAMYENLPLRHDQMPAGPNIRIHRRIRYGALADFTLLDARQYRSSHVGHVDPDATMLGGKQRDWLIDGLSESSARWQIIGNQQPMVQIDRNPDPDAEGWFGSWDGGFVTERDLVLTEAHQRGVQNLVVTTGDRHTNYLADLKTDYTDPDSPVVGSEIVGTSLSSNGDGADMLPVGEQYMQTNPWLKFFNAQRGYCRITLTPDALVNDYRVVPYVSRPGAPIRTRATATIENGRPGSDLDLKDPVSD